LSQEKSTNAFNTIGSTYYFSGIDAEKYPAIDAMFRLPAGGLYQGDIPH
jgi:hypothetical protein